MLAVGAGGGSAGGSAGGAAVAPELPPQPPRASQSGSNAKLGKMVRIRQDLCD